MTVGTPKTWADSAVVPVTASDMNAEVRDQLRELFGPKRAQVYRSTAMSLVSGTTPLVVTFDSEAYDTDTMWDAANPTRLQLTTAGLYIVIAHAFFGNYSTPTRHLQMRMNAAGASGGGTALPADQVYGAGASGSGKVGLVFERVFTAGQYLEMFVFQNSGATQASGLGGGASNIFLSARRVAI